MVVQHEDKFICVHEKGDRGWWLPGGGVDEKQLFSEVQIFGLESVHCTIIVYTTVYMSYPHRLPLEKCLRKRAWK